MRWLAVVLVGLLAGAVFTQTSSTPAAAAYMTPLKGVCPDRIVVQTDWFPEAEHGYTYQLIGPGGKIDKQKGAYSGPLGDTGVELEIRAGGPYIGFQPPVAQMYADEKILIGYMDTADQARNSKKLPTVAVMAPLDIGPQILMFDPKQYNFKTIADVGKAGATVLFFEGSAYMDYLLAKGFLNKKQIDGSYDGSPARWVSSGGKVVQQGFATNEPYKYENEIKGWQRPVGFLLVHDAGYTIYQSALGVRPQTISRYGECLKRLVPLFQQGLVDYFANPEPVNNELLRIVKEFASFWTLSAPANAWAVNQMKRLRVVSNAGNNTVGDFDMTRAQKLVDELLPIFKGKRLESFKPGLKAEDILTNRFISKGIKLPF
ncbi:MAG: ABC transporter substrate-binding protein [Armatimonadota bacterium]